jgi:hypothetical protein
LVPEKSGLESFLYCNKRREEKRKTGPRERKKKDREERGKEVRAR